MKNKEEEEEEESHLSWFSCGYTMCMFVDFVIEHMIGPH